MAYTEVFYPKLPMEGCADRIQDVIVRSGCSNGQVSERYRLETPGGSVLVLVLVKYLHRTGSEMEETAVQLKAAGIRLFAAHLKGKSWYDGEDYRKGSAFLIGNEGNGLREETAALADTYIKIPMEGRVESLNAAKATGKLMYEAARQRRGG